MTGKADALRAVSQQFKDRTNTVIEGVMAHLRDDNAKEILGPGLSPLIGRGTLKGLVTFAVYADVLRMVRDMVMADGEISDEEVQESLGLLQNIAGGFAKVRRKDYSAYTALSQTNARAFLASYTADKGLFGHANEATKWAGVELCRNIQSQCGESGPLDAFGRSLVAWGEAIAGSDSQDPREQIMLSTLREACSPLQSIDATEQSDEVTAWSEADMISLVSEAIKSFADDDSAVLNPDEYLRDLGERLGVAIYDEEFDEIAFLIEEQLGVALLPDCEQQLRGVYSIREYAAVVRTAIRENGTVLQLPSTAPSPLSTLASSDGGTATTTGGKSENAEAAQGKVLTMEVVTTFLDDETVVDLSEFTSINPDAAFALLQRHWPAGDPPTGPDLNGLVRLDDIAAAYLAELDGDLFLGVTDISDEGIRSLSRHKRDLHLAVTRLSDNAAQYLCRKLGHLCLEQLTDLSAEAARLLADHPDLYVDIDLWPTEAAAAFTRRKAVLTRRIAESFLADHEAVDLSEFVTIEDDAAELLSTSKGYLCLSSLVSLSEASARWLGEHEGELNLNSLTQLPVAIVRHLCKHRGALQLDGICHLGSEEATLLATHVGHLSLEGVRHLTDESAVELARHKGGLNLLELKFASPEAAEHLQKRNEERDIADYNNLLPDFSNMQEVMDYFGDIPKPLTGSVASSASIEDEVDEDEVDEDEVDEDEVDEDELR